MYLSINIPQSYLKQLKMLVAHQNYMCPLLQICLSVLKLQIILFVCTATQLNMDFKKSTYTIEECVLNDYTQQIMVVGSESECLT
jgi:hypothetical protein